MKKIYTSIITIMAFFFCVLFNPLTVKAGVVTDSDSFSHYFFYSDGGMCLITVDVQYSEYYTSNGTYKTYNERHKSVMVKRTYSKDEPYVVLGNVQHSNNTYFQTWKQLTLMYSTEWDYAHGYANYEKATYSMTTNATGTLYYSLQCDSAIMPVAPYSIVLQF